MRILLIDDSDAAGASLLRLRNFGFDVDCAVSVKAAESLAADGRGYDLILCDILDERSGGGLHTDELMLSPIRHLAPVLLLSDAAHRFARQDIVRGHLPTSSLRLNESDLLVLFSRLAASGELGRSQPCRSWTHLQMSFIRRSLDTAWDALLDAQDLATSDEARKALTVIEQSLNEIVVYCSEVESA